RIDDLEVLDVNGVAAADEKVEQQPRAPVDRVDLEPAHDMGVGLIANQLRDGASIEKGVGQDLDEEEKEARDVEPTSYAACAARGHGMKIACNSAGCLIPADAGQRLWS